MNVGNQQHPDKDTPSPITGTPVIFFGNTPLSTVATATPSKATLKVGVEEWFNEHKLVLFGLLPFVAIFVIIVLVCCCRCCCKKEKKPERKITSHGQGASLTHEEFHLPRFRKTAIQPGLSRTKEIKELGKLEFSLKYDYQRSHLNVNVISGQDFPLISSSNVSFTYVVVELRPFSEKYEAKAQTRYVRNTVSPVFNDTVNYKISVDELQAQILFLSVYDINHLSAHDLIGSVKIKIDKHISSGSLIYYKERLKWEEEISQTFGDILVGLLWKRKEEVLEIVLQEASNLKIMDQDRLTSNPYVKLQVYVNSFLVLKKRTKVEKKSLYPKFKKSFSVHVASDALAHNTQILLTVKHVAKFRKKQVIGQLYFGSEGKASVLEHWSAMRKSGKYMEMWHQLDSSINKSLLQTGSKVNYLIFDDNNSDYDTNADSSDFSAYGGTSFDYKSL